MIVIKIEDKTYTVAEELEACITNATNTGRL